MTERTRLGVPRICPSREVEATDEGLGFTSPIEKALRRALDEWERSSRRTPRGVLPPVSPVIGGLAPGIDLDNSAALQETNDLDYVSRFRWR